MAVKQTQVQVMLSYGWSKGSHISADPKEAVRETQKAVDDNGSVSPRLLWENNKAINAPLHKVFEWDDAVAGSLYRDEQARKVIRALVQFEPGKEQEAKRVYIHVPDEAERENGYYRAGELQDDEERLHAALKELIRLQDGLLRTIKVIEEML